MPERRESNPSNEKRRLYRREYYENTHLDVGAGAIRIDWLRRGNAAGYDNNDDHDPGGDDGSSNGCSGNTRSRSAAGTAVRSN